MSWRGVGVVSAPARRVAAPALQRLVPGIYALNLPNLLPREKYLLGDKLTERWSCPNILPCILALPGAAGC
jgi:hypothetical protein